MTMREIAIAAFAGIALTGCQSDDQGDGTIWQPVKPPTSVQSADPWVIEAGPQQDPNRGGFYVQCHVPGQSGRLVALITEAEATEEAELFEPGQACPDGKDRRRPVQRGDGTLPAQP